MGSALNELQMLFIKVKKKQQPKNNKKPTPKTTKSPSPQKEEEEEKMGPQRGFINHIAIDLVQMFLHSAHQAKRSTIMGLKGHV